MNYCRKLSHAVPAPFASEFIARVYYLNAAIRKVYLEPIARQSVELEIADDNTTTIESLGLKIDHVLDGIISKNREFAPRVLAQRQSTAAPRLNSPMDWLVQQGHIHEFGPGRVGLGPLLVALENRIDGDLLQMAQTLGAAPYRFPTVIGADVLSKCRYLQSFPQFLTLAMHLNENMDVLSQFSQECRLVDGAVVVPEGSLAPSTTVLSPTVCFHLYSWLEGQELNGPMSVTAKGHCHRYESRTMSGLERLWDFQMREIMFVGSSEHVEKQRTDCLEQCIRLLDKWNITYEIISATDPFYVDGFSAVANYQAAFELKYEIRVPLPYAPGRTMAIGSINRHHDFFGKSLNFKDKNIPGYSHTACVGFGLERVAWAWLCTHGVNPNDWPM